MKRNTDFIKHDLHDNDWIGVVINNTDPTFSGRAQVRVFRVMDGVVDEHIPWSAPVNSNIFGSDGGGSLSVPKLGQFVRIRFNNGDIYAPEITAIQNIDTELVAKIKDDYPGTHVLIHDADANLHIIHQNNTGLMIFYKESFFNITPDSMITLQTEDADSIIQLEGDITRIVTKNEVDIAAASKVTVTADEVVVKGSNTTKVGPGPYEPAVMYNELYALLLSMATLIDLKLFLTPGVATGLVETAKLAGRSTNVKISK